MRHAASHDRGNFLATHCVCHTRIRVISPCILIHLQVFECVWGYYGLGRSCGAACQYGNPLLGLWEHHYIRRAPHEITHRFQHELIADTHHVLTRFKRNWIGTKLVGKSVLSDDSSHLLLLGTRSGGKRRRVWPMGLILGQQYSRSS